VSFIGTLDQFDLSIILQKIEEYRKTGLLAIKQGESAVELFVRQGQLICIGPVKPGVSLGERLLQAGVISPEVCGPVEVALGELRYSENNAVNAYIDAGCVNQESLRRWAITEASQVLHAILAWEDGELYFQENQPPPTYRYLLPLSIASLLSEMPPAPSAPVSLSPASSFISATSLLTDFGFPANAERNTDAMSQSSVQSFQQPYGVTDTLPPVRVDMSYLQPNMVLIPADLSAYRESNPQVILTPEQWRLFTRANGETTLSMSAQELGMSPDQVCQAAGTLHALGLVTILSPGMTFAPPAALAYRYAGQPAETQSQWGNGGNRATFQLGNGWVVSSTPPQDDPAPEHNRAFAQVR
jgi:Domain of unknown function (DUF4388)